MSGEEGGSPAGGLFPMTPWSMILAAANAGTTSGRDALNRLFSAYWYPLYAFIRSRGHSPEEAEDLVQDLCADLLSRGDLAHMDPDKGRFRSFLMACGVNHLARYHQARKAARRGGGQRPLSLDRLLAEARLSAEPLDKLTPERLFDRQWALNLLERVVTRLDAECRVPPRHVLYDRLRPVILDQPGAPRPGEIADALGLSPGSVRTAAYRLRRRYRELLREEVGATVADPAEIDEEIRALIAALEPWRT